MHPFQVTMIVSSTALILVTALFLIIRTMPSRPGIGWWLGAAFIQSCAYFLALVFHGAETETIGKILFFCLQTAVNQAVIIGVMLFIGQQIQLRYWIAPPAVMVATASILMSFGQVLWANMVFAGYFAALFLLSAWTVFRLKLGYNSIKVTATLFALTGIHWLDFPFLEQFEWAVMFGFLVGMSLAVGIFLSLAALALLQFREQTKASEKKAIYAAIHDPLTGLYNRSYLDHLFAEYSEEAEQTDRSFMLLYFDLDGFKAVNDRYGHKAGDVLLTTVAKRMEKWLGAKGDAIRVGGDELVVLTRLRGTYRIENAYATARYLLDLIELPIVDGNHEHQISASIGGCCYQPKGERRNLDDMINCADKLMYTAKQCGGGCIYFPDFPRSQQHLEHKKTAVSSRQQAVAELA